MKRVMVLIIALALMGCATTKQTSYIPPNDFAYRVNKTKETICYCMNIEKCPKHFIANDRNLNAWVDGGKVYITEGLKNVDNDSLAFILAHENAHIIQSHQGKEQALSYGITTAMLVANAFLPGVGLLNHAVNPAISNNFSKVQEADADKMASVISSKCFNVDLDKQVKIMTNLKNTFPDSGGFWDRHPSWDDRIANISR